MPQRCDSSRPAHDAGARVFDLLLRGGTVIDGSGAPGRRADVGIADARIAAVGDLAAAGARQIVDAAGLAVCPGFIDVHSHSDVYLLIAPDAASKVSQGVTAEIVGQCGCSAAPRGAAAPLPADWEAAARAAGLPAPADPAGAAPWQTVAEYRRYLVDRGHAVHVAMLAGHNALRATVMGYAPRPATAAETAAMGRLLAEALAQGACGLSTGLLYQPGCHAAAGEVTELARVAAEAGGIYASHMRNEGDRLLEALDEALAVARATGVRLQVSHLKTSGRANWAKLDEALARIETARADGLRVHADRYPYVAGATDLDVVLPGWAANGGREAVRARLDDDDARRRIAAELDASRPREAWQGVLIGGTWHPDLRPFRGRSVLEAAAKMGCTPGDAIANALRLDGLRTGAFFFGMSEENLRRIYGRGWVMVGSDASLRAPEGPLADDHPHPRAYGTFPRFLRTMALDGGALSIEEAVRRCTSLPAGAFGLGGRGTIVPGAWADLAVVDLAAVRDRATYDRPQQFSEGIRLTVVNGAIVWDGSRTTGARPGCWLTPEWEKK